MEPGQSVRVKAFGGKVLQRIVIKQLSGTIVICTEEEWKAATQECREPEGVGFPVSAVIHEK